MKKIKLKSFQDKSLKIELKKMKGGQSTPYIVILPTAVVTGLQDGTTRGDSEMGVDDF